MIDKQRLEELQEAFARALCSENRDDPDTIVYALPPHTMVIAGTNVVRPVDIGKPFPLWKLYINQARILVDAYVSESSMQNTADRVLADLDKYENRQSPGIVRLPASQYDFGQSEPVNVLKPRRSRNIT
jgi:hypothetical protein